MAIVQMKQFSLYVLKNRMDSLIEELRHFEYIHFSDLNEKDEQFKEGLDTIEVGVESAGVDEQLNKVNALLKMLKKYDARPTGMAALKAGPEELSLEELYAHAKAFDFDGEFSEINEIARRIEESEQKRQNLLSKIEHMTPWERMDIDLSEIDSFKKVDMYYGSVPKRFEEGLNEFLANSETVYYEKISEYKGNVNILFATLKDETQAFMDEIRKYGFVRAEIKGEGKVRDIVTADRQSVEKLKEEKAALIQELKEKATILRDLELYYEYLQNEKLKYSNKRNFLRTKNILLLEGYVPEPRSEEFVKLLDEKLGDEYYVEMKAVEKDDENVPILLKNGKVIDSFSGVIEMYSLPKYNEVDPTPLFAPFYWLFFGMMGADIGYGLLLFAACFFALKVFNLKDSMRKFVRFFLFLSISITLWGAVYGSFFGGIIELPFIINMQKDFVTLLLLSVVLGLIHLTFALAIKGYMHVRDGRPIEVLYDVIFWYMALGGAIMLLVSSSLGMSPMVGTISKWTMIVGMVGILLFAGRESKSIGGRLGQGFYELYGISGYVGDLVSYTRLMAIGLSGGFIGFAINMIVKMVASSGMVGATFAAIIFLPFHLFNIFLTLLSAYVHTSRLTYVEFFGKFFEGGGKAFKRFRAEPKYIKIKDNH